MDKDYTGYKADQLLNDDQFIQWLLCPNTENELFWNTLKKKDQELAKEIATACSFINHLQQDIKQPELSNTDEILLWNKIHAINQKSKKQEKMFQLFKAVAGIAAMICLGLFTIQKLYYSEKDINYQAILNATEQANYSSNEIELILSEHEKIAIAEENSEVEYNQKGEINVNSQKIIAKTEEKNDTEIFNQLIVPYGKRSSITFSDGTQIWVNSGSKVVYPVSFEKKKREIYVEGEIFLEVAHDKTRPFIVKTQQIDVRVLGTSFNVSAYKDEQNIQVTLVKGKVEVNTKDKVAKTLSPDQQFSYDCQTDKTDIQVVDVENFIAWKNGYYQFEKQPLNIVFKKLSKYYGVKLEWDEAIGKLTCSGKLDLKDDINDVLNNLKNTKSFQITHHKDKIKININP